MTVPGESTVGRQLLAGTAAWILGYICGWGAGRLFWKRDGSLVQFLPISPGRNFLRNLGESSVFLLFVAVLPCLLLAIRVVGSPEHGHGVADSRYLKATIMVGWCCCLLAGFTSRWREPVWARILGFPLHLLRGLDRRLAAGWPFFAGLYFVLLFFVDPVTRWLSVAAKPLVTLGVVGEFFLFVTVPFAGVFRAFWSPGIPWLAALIPLILLTYLLALIVRVARKVTGATCAMPDSCAPAPAEREARRFEIPATRRLEPKSQPEEEVLALLRASPRSLWQWLSSRYAWIMAVIAAAVVLLSRPPFPDHAPGHPGLPVVGIVVAISAFLAAHRVYRACVDWWFFPLRWGALFRTEARLSWRQWILGDLLGAGALAVSAGEVWALLPVLAAFALVRVVAFEVVCCDRSRGGGWNAHSLFCAGACVTAFVGGAFTVLRLQSRLTLFGALSLGSALWLFLLAVVLGAVCALELRRAGQSPVLPVRLAEGITYDENVRIGA
jgi:hypothetical protein